MKKNKTIKQLAKSQRKLKRAFKKLGNAGKNAEAPAWIAALSAMAGAVAAALSDEEKRAKLKEVAIEAKEKLAGVLSEKPKGGGELEPVPEDVEATDVHLGETAEAEESREHV